MMLIIISSPHFNLVRYQYSILRNKFILLVIGNLKATFLQYGQNTVLRNDNLSHIDVVLFALYRYIYVKLCVCVQFSVKTKQFSKNEQLIGQIWILIVSFLVDYMFYIV